MKRQKANSLENIRCSKELTCFEGLLGHVLRSFEIVELISDIARFTIRFEPVFKKKKKKNRFQGFFLRGGLTSNIAIQPVLQKFCKTSCSFFWLVRTVPLVKVPPSRSNWASQWINGFICNMSAGHRSYPLIFPLFLSIKKLKIPSEVAEVAAINLL